MSAVSEGTKLIELDRTEIFTHLRFWPIIRVSAGDEDLKSLEGEFKKPWQRRKNTAWSQIL